MKLAMKPRRFLLACCACCCLATSPFSPTVATYTPQGGTFNGTDFGGWLVSQSGAGVRELAVAPGRYAVPALQPGSSAHVALAAPLAEGVRIDMRGVRLVMGVRTATALYIAKWTNVTLFGLTIAYAELPTNQATVLALGADGTSIDVAVPAGYPLGDWAARAVKSCNVYVGGSRYLRVGSGDLSASSIEPLPTPETDGGGGGGGGPDDGRSFRMHFPNKGQLSGGPLVGDTLGCRNAAFAFTVHVDGCARSTLRDITLEGGPGFGFFHGTPAPDGSGTSLPHDEGSNTFDGLVLTYPSAPLTVPAGSPHSATTATPPLLLLPVLSASADAFHLSGVRGGPTIANCLFEGHNDDGIALHGSYSVIVDSSSSSSSSSSSGGTHASSSVPTATTTARLTVAGTTFGVGDEVRIYDTHFVLAATVRVTAVAPAQPQGRYAPPRNASHTMPGAKLLPEPRTWYTVLDVVSLSVVNGSSSAAVGAGGGAPPPPPPLPAGLGFDYIAFNADRSCSGFALRNNTIRNHRARGMLVKASRGVIEHNTIANSTLGGIIVTPELYWGEGDFARDLVIRNNSITSVCTGRQCYGGLALGASGPDGSFVPPRGGGGHRNITIVGNRFANISQMSLWVSSTTDLLVANNTIVAPYAYAPVATCCPPLPYPTGLVAWMTQTSGATVSGNCVDRAPAVPGVRIFEVTPTVVDSDVVDGGLRLC